LGTISPLIKADHRTHFDVYAAALEEADKQIPWEDVSWSLFDDYSHCISPRVAAGMARNLDLLIEVFLSVVRDECPKAYEAVTVLMKQGEN